MNEYVSKNKTVKTAASAEPARAAQVSGGIPNSSMEAIMAGRARASSEMMGHRQDLAPSLHAKMSKAFGMDLSGMQIYRSQAMSDAGEKGMASGNKIVLSRDVNLNTTAGQAILGHELSHVRAQSRGIGMGHTGLYQNDGLEHQADVEGAMAARGQNISGESAGMDMSLGMGGLGGLTPVGAGLSASAGAPMQAWGKKKKNTSHADEDYWSVPKEDEDLAIDEAYEEAREKAAANAARPRLAAGAPVEQRQAPVDAKKLRNLKPVKNLKDGEKFFNSDLIEENKNKTNNGEFAKKMVLKNHVYSYKKDKHAKNVIDNRIEATPEERKKHNEEKRKKIILKPKKFDLGHGAGHDLKDAFVSDEDIETKLKALYTIRNAKRRGIKIEPEVLEKFEKAEANGMERSLKMKKHVAPIPEEENDSDQE